MAGRDERGVSVPGAERREARRYVSLIRAAKLVGDRGEFVCVIRDVSSSGIGLKCFHRVPPGDLALVLQNGDRYSLETARSDGNDASFRFTEEIDVDRLIVEVGHRPKRRLRYCVDAPGKVGKTDRMYPALVRNLSQQGAHVETGASFAIEEPIVLELETSKRIGAKTRWRRDGRYGIIFEDILSLGELARLVAELQAPELLKD